MAELVSIIGRLRRLRRPGGGSPEQPLPPEEVTDPDYGLEGGGSVELPIELPEPPPGVWPPPNIAHPIQPIAPPAPGAPGNLPSLPPGLIWPPPGRPENPIALPPGKFVVLAIVPGYGVKYVVVDPSLKPSQPK